MKNLFLIVPVVVLLAAGCGSKNSVVTQAPAAANTSGGQSLQVVTSPYQTSVSTSTPKPTPVVQSLLDSTYIYNNAQYHFKFNYPNNLTYEILTTPQGSVGTYDLGVDFNKVFEVYVNPNRMNVSQGLVTLSTELRMVNGISMQKMSYSDPASGAQKLLTYSFVSGSNDYLLVDYLRNSNSSVSVSSLQFDQIVSTFESNVSVGYVQSVDSKGGKQYINFTAVEYVQGEDAAVNACEQDKGYDCARLPDGYYVANLSESSDENPKIEMLQVSDQVQVTMTSQCLKYPQIDPGPDYYDGTTVSYTLFLNAFKDCGDSGDSLFWIQQDGSGLVTSIHEQYVP